MTTDTGNFDLHRSFSISRDKLWHLITDAKMREAWGAPGEGMVLQMTTADFRTGGQEHHICGPADAPEFEVETRWYQIAAPTDAVFTETIQVGADKIATSLVTYRVSETPTGSELAVHVSVSSFTGPGAAEEFHQGWEAGLSNLAALAEKSS